MRHADAAEDPRCEPAGRPDHAVRHEMDEPIFRRGHGEHSLAMPDEPSYNAFSSPLPG
ncbi:hypothetical protein [Benzoatithermus flavus]|uniref:Uncharacterized protein n=1 Tax=Benzoatithermus flavus TaxID=3108223 RepID=A0ABU8XYI8_9PROT